MVALFIWKKTIAICSYIKMARKLISVAIMACLKLMLFLSIMKAKILPVKNHTAFGYLTTWPRRLAHTSKERLVRIRKNNAVKLKVHNLVNTVSSDVKKVPFATFRGMQYAVKYVDHFSLLGMVFYVRSKAAIYNTFDRYLREMKALGVQL